MAHFQALSKMNTILREEKGIEKGKEKGKEKEIGKGKQTTKTKQNKQILAYAHAPGVNRRPYFSLGMHQFKKNVHFCT